MLRCPLCGEEFRGLRSLVDHIREKSYEDKNHEILLTAYCSLITHMDMVLGDVFRDFLRGLDDIDRRVREAKRLKSEDIDAVLSEIRELVEKIPKPSSPLHAAVYESAIPSILAVLEWKHRTKRDLLRILSEIKALFTENKKAYITMVLKASMIPVSYTHLTLPTTERV